MRQMSNRGSTQHLSTAHLRGAVTRGLSTAHLRGAITRGLSTARLRGAVTRGLGVVLFGFGGVQCNTFDDPPEHGGATPFSPFTPPAIFETPPIATHLPVPVTSAPSSLPTAPAPFATTQPVPTQPAPTLPVVPTTWPGAVDGGLPPGEPTSASSDVTTAGTTTAGAPNTGETLAGSSAAEASASGESTTPEPNLDAGLTADHDAANTSGQAATEPAASEGGTVEATRGTPVAIGAGDAGE